MKDWTKLKRGTKRRIAGWLLTWDGHAHVATAKNVKQQIMLRVVQGERGYQAQLTTIHNRMKRVILCDAATAEHAVVWAMQACVPSGLWAALHKVAGEDAK